VDEQLMPLKSRCPFIMFMPKKPDKFGVKFWMLVEVKTKYVVSMIPYLGKENDTIRVGSLSEEVVLQLVASVKNKEYNLTMDNFFTSLHLAAQLKANGTSLVGTMRQNRRELPEDFLKPDKTNLYKSTFFTNEETGALLCKYNCKKNRTIALCIQNQMWTLIPRNASQKLLSSTIKIKLELTQWTPWGVFTLPNAQPEDGQWQFGAISWI